MIAKYRDRQYLVIRGETVLGGYETYEQAVDEAAKHFGRGPSLVRSVYHPEDPEPVDIPALRLGILFGPNRRLDVSDGKISLKPIVPED